MRLVTDSTRRLRTLALGAAILALLPLTAEATNVMHVQWRELSMVTGHTIRIFLPGGNITGKAGTVEADALAGNALDKHWEVIEIVPQIRGVHARTVTQEFSSRR